MTSGSLLPGVLLVVLACLTSGPAVAHEYWLEPSAFRAAAGETLVVRAFVGTGFRGEIKPWSPARARRFELRGQRTVNLARSGVNGDLVWSRCVLPDAGGAVVLFESDFAHIELEAAKFDAYLAAEGLEGPHASRVRQGAAAGPGRERYSRCCKAWISGSQSRRVQEPIGLTLEIVPLANPDSVTALPLRVLYAGKPLAGALVRTWCAGPAVKGAAERDSVGPGGQARTDGSGRATLRCDRPGEWLVNVVHMVPSEDIGSDWDSWWASLTFVRSAHAVAPSSRSSRSKFRK